MTRYIISNPEASRGEPTRLNGTVRVQGAKNAALPLIAAAVLTDKEAVLTNCPDITDVENMLKIFSSLGGVTERRGDTVRLRLEYMRSHEIPSGLAGELRSSVFMLGSVLARSGKAKVAYPGGCDIGLRPIDIHLKALREMGVKVSDRYGYLLCDAADAHGAEVTLDYPSVGATENVMLLAAGIPGKTVIHNAAREPEIEDLGNFLTAMGAEVLGAGTQVITICGTKERGGVEYRVMPDRIAAGTYLIAAAANGGSVTLKDVRPEHIFSLIGKLRFAGAEIDIYSDSVTISASGRPKAVGVVETGAYPGFPTDLQAPFSVLAAVSEGSTVIVENIFETRFKHVAELTKMGASVKVKGRVAVFEGVKRLTAAKVQAMDLRGGAALITAGLKANGTTVVENGYHIERGYVRPEEVFGSLGAYIIKV